jgi:two-component system, NarL family, nitrate/nitrite response regulator NarL
MAIDAGRRSLLPPITAAIISDVRLYREGIAGALSHRGRISVAAVASSIDEAFGLLAEVRPDVIVVDMAMRGSLDAVRVLSARLPETKIVAFAVDDLEAQIASCAEAGISGYVPCDASIDDLEAMIESVSREESPCSPRVAAALFRHIATLASGVRASTATALSQREQQILTLIRSGLSNKEIAHKLNIEVATVKNHVHNLLTKLGVSTRAEAAAHAEPAAFRSRSSHPLP